MSKGTCPLGHAPFFVYLSYIKAMKHLSPIFTQEETSTYSAFQSKKHIAIQQKNSRMFTHSAAFLPMQTLSQLNGSGHRPIL